MPSTLAEVARRAGVSEATASRVLNRRRYVSPDSRIRVETAARELDYVPNRAARDLSTARTATVALLVHHSQYPAGGEGTFSSRVVHGVTRGLAEAGRDLLYVVVDDHALAGIATLPAVRPGRTDGVLVLGPAFPAAAIRSLVEGGRPVVLIDNRAPWLHVDSVMADNRPATEALTRHLVADHRYRRVACLAGPLRWASTAERVAGYRAALAMAGLPARVVHARETTIRDGAARVLRLLDDPPEAIVAVNDALAIGALHRLRTLAGGRPAVVGFDDTAWARLADPPLTSVAVDAQSMGALAARLIVERLSGAWDGPARRLRVPAIPRIRASCGCPAGADEPL